MNSDKSICHFYLSKEFEKIFFDYNIVSEDITFKISGINKEETQSIGNMFLAILNNFDTIIKILEDSKAFSDNYHFDLRDFLKEKLDIINNDLSKIICTELDKYYSAENKSILETKENVRHINEELEKHYLLFKNDELYNKYYDDMIEDIKQTIENAKSKEEIDYEKEFLNDLYDEKSNKEKGNEAIRHIIRDLKKEKRKARKQERDFSELPKLINDYISKLINSINKYSYYIDLYYGFLEEMDLKNKDISYFQSVFGTDFQIPRHYIYACFEENNKIIPIKNLILSIYTNTKALGELYKKILEITNNLNNDNKIMYLKSYEIHSLEDVLNIYFNYYVDSNICIKKCKNCNNYFIPSSRTDEKYCDNISPQNPNKTCKEYGAKKTYRDEIKSTPIKYEHNKTSQFYRMRINRAKIPKEKEQYQKKFNTYKDNYQKKKEKYNAHKLEELAFVEWIRNQKEF